MAEETTRVVIRHPTGLHARPAIKLTKLAKEHPATIRLRGLPGGDWVDAKSIVKVMALKLKTGTEIELAAEGEAAPEALAALVDLVERNFDEHG